MFKKNSGLLSILYDNWQNILKPKIFSIERNNERMELIELELYFEV